MTDVDPQFLAFLNQEESRSYDGTLLEEVEAALRSYNRDAYGNEEEGRSQVVAGDVSESADYMLTSLLDVVAGSDHIVEFEPTGEADEQGCDDATVAMHYIYRRKNGFRLMHDWGKAGLLEKIAIVKSCVERKKKRVEALYHPAMLPDNAIEATQTDEPHPVDGSPMIHAVTLEETAATFPDYHVPLEEFRIAADARDFDNAVYLAHLPQKRISELTEMGFDVSGLDLSQGSNSFLNTLGNARDDGRNSWYGAIDRDGVNRTVTFNEEYVLYDLDGDGISERLCVSRVGNTILTRSDTGKPAIEPVDYQPFEYWCPFPMQGRLIGQSQADKTMDFQVVNSVLLRNALDSLYSQVAPGHYVHEDSCGDHTIDDLLTVRPNRLVRYTGQVAPIPEKKNDVSQIAFNAVEFMSRLRENATGITQLNKGVDEDTLNDTARGQAQLMARGQQMERYVIRQFVEGVARLFMKKVGLMRRYAQPFQIRVDGQYRTIDPSQWPEDMEVAVKAGLGSGSKQNRVMGLQTIGQVQSMLKMAGSQIVSDDNVYNACTALARAFGLQPNDYFTEPPKDEQGNPIPQQQPPDPKAQALMAQIQVKQQAIEAQQQADAAKLQQMMAQHADETQIELLKQHQEAAIAVRQQNLQAFIDQQQMILEAHKHAAQLDSQQKIAKMRPGGKLDA
jgi:hypothetical protein